VEFVNLATNALGKTLGNLLEIVEVFERFSAKSYVSWL
jgi:hypothetical protein